MTAGIVTLLVAAVVIVLLGVAASVVGIRAAFLTFCWLPLAGLLLTIAFHHHLGYSGIGVLAATIAGSAGLTSLGGRLIAGARREKSGVGSLIAGTTLAAVPLVLVTGWMALAALN